MKLTDEDWRDIQRNVELQWQQGNNAGSFELAIYLAGIRAGLERAAKVCDGMQTTTQQHSGFTISWPAHAIECATAIRALASKP